jgi:hypothetical protein
MENEWKARHAAGEWFNGGKSALKRFAQYGCAFTAFTMAGICKDAPRMATDWRKLAKEAREAATAATDALRDNRTAQALNDLGDYAAGRAQQLATLANIGRAVERAKAAGVDKSMIRNVVSEAL